MPENKTRLEAIADPVRLALVRHLASAGESRSLQELSDVAGVHSNTARAHLRALVGARVVEREHLTGGGRGRPSVRYRLASEWTVPSTDLRELAALLAAIALRGVRSRSQRSEVARDWGRHLAGAPGVRNYGAALRRALERLGADTSVAPQSLELTACPCPLVAPDHPELVCDLLMAAADGVLERCGASTRIGARTHDHATRRCRAELRPVAAG
jgi:predicted ArsR family transcriptional regulator